jgi:hypothetical protein
MVRTPEGRPIEILHPAAEQTRNSRKVSENAYSTSAEEPRMKMRAARMYGYNEPLRIEEIPVPDIGADEVLIKVAAAGMCRSDFQLVEGTSATAFR